MIIRSETYQELESDIAELFDAVPEYIQEKVEEINANCESTDEETLNRLMDSFIAQEARLDQIDTFLAYHLTVCGDDLKVIKPLNEVLTDENSELRILLADNNLRIVNGNGHLRLYQNGKEIDPQVIRNRAQLLARRLGCLGEPDYCINGFSFWKDIRETSDGYYDQLEKGPEFLRCIDEFLGTKLAQTFRKRNHYYGLAYEVPFTTAIFDSHPTLSIHEKKQYYVHNALKMLLGYYLGYPYLGSNPMVRIPDAESAQVSFKILAKQ